VCSRSRSRCFSQYPIGRRSSLMFPPSRGGALALLRFRTAGSSPPAGGARPPNAPGVRALQPTAVFEEPHGGRELPRRVLLEELESFPREGAVQHVDSRSRGAGHLDAHGAAILLIPDTPRVTGVLDAI